MAGSTCRRDVPTDGSVPDRMRRGATGGAGDSGVPPAGPRDRRRASPAAWASPIDEVEDLRLAIDELCFALDRQHAAGPARSSCATRSTPTASRSRGSATSTAAVRRRSTLTELSEQILDGRGRRARARSPTTATRVPAASSAAARADVAFDAGRARRAPARSSPSSRESRDAALRDRAGRGPPRSGRVPGPPVQQPRRAARRPRAGRVGRPGQGRRPLRPRAGGRVLHLRHPHDRRRAQAPLPRQGLGRAGAAPHAGAVPAARQR